MRPRVARRVRRVVLSCDGLEDRVTPAHVGLAHHAVAHLHAAVHTARASAAYRQVEYNNHDLDGGGGHDLNGDDVHCFDQLV